jgi:hypothetical protein
MAPSDPTAVPSPAPSPSPAVVPLSSPTGNIDCIVDPYGVASVSARGSLRLPYPHSAACASRCPDSSLNNFASVQWLTIYCLICRYTAASIKSAPCGPHYLIDLSCEHPSAASTYALALFTGCSCNSSAVWLHSQREATMWLSTTQLAIPLQQKQS